VNLLLTEDAVDSNARDCNGQTPLWWAAKNGHKAVAKLLQSRGAL
jgi:ankyrin repeat protein